MPDAPFTESEILKTPPEEFTIVPTDSKDVKASAFNENLVTFGNNRVAALAIIDNQRKTQKLLRDASQITAEDKDSTFHLVYADNNEAKNSADAISAQLRSLGVPDENISRNVSNTGTIIENGVVKALSSEATHGLMAAEAIKQYQKLDPNHTFLNSIESAAKDDLPNLIALQGYRFNKKNSSENPSLQLINSFNSSTLETVNTPTMSEAARAYNSALKHTMYSDPDRFLPAKMKDGDNDSIAADLMQQLSKKIEPSDDSQKKAMIAAQSLKKMLSPSSTVSREDRPALAYEKMDLDNNGSVTKDEARQVFESLRSIGVVVDVERAVQNAVNYQPTQKNTDKSNQR